MKLHHRKKRYNEKHCNIIIQGNQNKTHTIIDVAILNTVSKVLQRANLIMEPVISQIAGVLVGGQGMFMHGCSSYAN